MSDIRLEHLRAYSPSAVEEGQDYWTVGIPEIIEALWNEISESPKVRGLNPATGEIVEGPLLVLLGHLTRWAREGQNFRVEAIR